MTASQLDRSLTPLPSSPSTQLSDLDSFGPFTLRCYQKAIRSNITPMWGSTFGQLIVAPTGSGKTLTAMVCCQDWLDLQDHLHGDREAIIVWVAMRRELFEEAEKVCGIMGLDTSRFFFRSMFANDWSQFLGKRIMMVVDESHHAACDTCVSRKLILKPQNLLGMSATPIRADQMALGFQRTIYESDYNSLIAKGYLSKYHHYRLPEWSPELVAFVINREPERWGKSVVFFRLEQDCLRFMESLNPELRKRAGFIHGGMDRDAEVTAFKKGDLDILVNMKILTEGFDEPSMKTVFVDPSQSEVDCIQKSGRVMRLWENQIKQVVQCSGFKSFEEVAEPELRFAYHNQAWHQTENSMQAMFDSMVNFDDLDFGDFDDLSDNQLLDIFNGGKGG